MNLLSRFLSVAAVSVLGIVAAGGAEGIAGKIATVDLELVVRSHPDTEKNKATLRTTQKRYEEQRDAVKARIEKLRVRFTEVSEQAGNEALSPIGREAKRQEARELLGKLQEEEDELRQLVARLQRSLSETELLFFEGTMKDVNARIEELVAERGLALVVDKSAGRPGAPVPVVLWADPALDLTEELVRRLGGELVERPVEEGE